MQIKTKYLGMQLYKKKDYKAALDKFQRAESIKVLQYFSNSFFFDEAND